MSVPVVAIVPSLGVPRDAGRSLAALRRELAACGGHLVWVHQGGEVPPVIDRPGERLVRLAEPVGFARSIHAGIAVAAAAPLLALVNDDLEVEAGWLGALMATLAAAPQLGAVQGVNRLAADPRRLDGLGIGWNRWWQAIQLGHGEPWDPGLADREVFGVSATGAVYRRAALDAVAGAPGRPFDERLGSWYEDVDLAVRLRAAGWQARCVAAARALHAGSATGARRPFDRARRVTANRWLVVARLTGRRFPLLLPRLLLRDGVDAARALAAGRAAEAFARPAGWVTALARLPGFARAGRPLLSEPEMARFRVGSPA
jgi:GT2 family glycosyltransferase